MTECTEGAQRWVQRSSCLTPGPPPGGPSGSDTVQLASLTALSERPGRPGVVTADQAVITGRRRRRTWEDAGDVSSQREEKTSFSVASLRPCCGNTQRITSHLRPPQAAALTLPGTENRGCSLAGSFRLSDGLITLGSGWTRSFRCHTEIRTKPRGLRDFGLSAQGSCNL